jgi:hypothetical protein
MYNKLNILRDREKELEKEISKKKSELIYNSSNPVLEQEYVLLKKQYKDL